VLFNDSIYYNILYGQPEASREQVLAAAESAQLAGFIERLPDGYEPASANAASSSRAARNSASPSPAPC
jgi:ABC-type transport system involved in Fe-S cluster assembly fused permease/ATPase subunit